MNFYLLQNKKIVDVYFLKGRWYIYYGVYIFYCIISIKFRFGSGRCKKENLKIKKSKIVKILDFFGKYNYQYLFV